MRRSILWKHPYYEDYPEKTSKEATALLRDCFAPQDMNAKYGNNTLKDDDVSEIEEKIDVIWADWCEMWGCDKYDSYAYIDYNIKDFVSRNFSKIKERL